MACSASQPLPGIVLYWNKQDRVSSIEKWMCYWVVRFILSSRKPLLRWHPTTPYSEQPCWRRVSGNHDNPLLPARRNRKRKRARDSWSQKTIARGDVRFYRRSLRLAASPTLSRDVASAPSLQGVRRRVYQPQVRSGRFCRFTVSKGEVVNTRYGRRSYQTQPSWNLDSKN